MKKMLILAIAALLMPAAHVRADDAPAASDKEIRKLINQLGSGDYEKRDEAAKRLKEIGKPALPALKKAMTEAQDAEIASRAQALVKRMEIRPLPKGDPALGNIGSDRPTRVRLGSNGGNRVMEVTEGGREIKITEGPDGITLAVTGLVDGEQATEEYTAQTADQLKEENPEAFALYEQLGGPNGPAFLFGRGRFGGQVQINGGILIQPAQVAPDELAQLRTSLEKQMKEKKLKDDQQAEINKEIDKLIETRNAQANIQMEKYTEQCDAFRKTLEEYKLDPGTFLPPPAKTRLGVSVLNDEGNLVVQRIGEKSRAERIGLREGDRIRKIDGKEVVNVTELRKAVGAKDKGLVVEITRNGDDIKLEEKAEKAEKEEKPAK